MSKKFKNKYKVKYAESGKKSEIPGQLCLDIKPEKKEGYEVVEQRIRKCSTWDSKGYWNALEDFLVESGKFSRTWYLYLSVKDLPEEEDLKEKFNDPKTTTHDKEFIEDQLVRYDVMRKRHGCDTRDDLKRKVNHDKVEYESKLNILLNKAEKAGVGLGLDPKNPETRKKKNDMLNAFVCLHDQIRGSARRQYFREKFVNPAKDELKEQYYSDPISILTMEKAFKADLKWQEIFLAGQNRRKEKRKEKRRNKT